MVLVNEGLLFKMIIFETKYFSFSREWDDLLSRLWPFIMKSFEFLNSTIYAIHHVISKMYVYYIAVWAIKFPTREIKLNQLSDFFVTEKTWNLTKLKLLEKFWTNATWPIHHISSKFSSYYSFSWLLIQRSHFSTLFLRDDQLPKKLDPLVRTVWECHAFLYYMKLLEFGVLLELRVLFKGGTFLSE